VVATLVWLYISTVSVLIGAEFNAHLYPKPQRLPNAPVAGAPAAPAKETMVAAGKAHQG
jgi:uncharacterized BrkB/YihY/UPF0761 family membrane protein